MEKRKSFEAEIILAYYSIRAFSGCAGDVVDEHSAAALRQACEDEYAGVRECASCALRKILKSGNSS